MQTETLAIRVSKADRAAIKRRAKLEKLSQGNLVRRALRVYGVTSDPKPNRTGYDVIAHLLGRNRSGARDLSTNPAHLADYGR